MLGGCSQVYGKTRKSVYSARPCWGEKREDLQQGRGCWQPCSRGSKGKEKASWQQQRQGDQAEGNTGRAEQAAGCAASADRPRCRLQPGARCKVPGAGRQQSTHRCSACLVVIVHRHEALLTPAAGRDAQLNTTQHGKLSGGDTSHCHHSNGAAHTVSRQGLLVQDSRLTLRFLEG